MAPKAVATASRNALALGKRSAGDLARASATMSSKRASACAPSSVDGGAARSFTTLYMSASCGPVKGGRPATIWYSTTPVL